MVVEVGGGIRRSCVDASITDASVADASVADAFAADASASDALVVIIRNGEWRVK